MTSSDQSTEITWDFREETPTPYCVTTFEGYGNEMRINEKTRKSIVFLGVMDGQGRFAPYGTGFIGRWQESELLVFCYIITAKHVVEDMRATGRPMVIRINTRDGKSDFAHVTDNLWVTHPDDDKCDIAVTGIYADLHTFDFLPVDLQNGIVTSSYIEDNDIGNGAELFTTGLLTAHFGKSANVPVVRIGNIASMPDEPVDLGPDLGAQSVYLIESRSIGGLSGSPVFLHTPPHRVIRSDIKMMTGHRSEYLLGVNIRMFESKADADDIRADTASQRKIFLDTMSAGIAIVVPIQRAIEIIETKFEEQRANAVKRKKKESPFVATSTGGSGTPINDPQSMLL